MRALNESIRQYAAGARILGMDERLPETQVNELGHVALEFLKKPALAVWVFRRVRGSSRSWRGE